MKLNHISIKPKLNSIKTDYIYSLFMKFWN